MYPNFLIIHVTGFSAAVRQNDLLTKPITFHRGPCGLDHQTDLSIMDNGNDELDPVDRPRTKRVKYSGTNTPQ
jgi:hypothetical protein